VTEARLLHRQDLVVELDHGQFYLHTADNAPELAAMLLGRAQDGVGIAQAAGLVVVTSPHQNNFAMPLLVEVWDGEPVGDLAQWQEAFEAHLDVAVDGLVYESPTMDMVEIEVPQGSYHALITGRGFVAYGWPGSSEPGDEWRIWLWPSAGPANPARLRQFTGADDAVEEPDGLGAGLRTADGVEGYDASLEEQRESDARQAGLRIGADLDQAPSARALSGRVGTATVDVIIPRGIAAVWPLIANLDITNMSGPNGAVVGNEFSMSTYDGQRDGFVGTDGQIVCRWTELDEPTRVAMTWTWMGPPPGTQLSTELSTKQHYERMRAGLLPRNAARFDRPAHFAVNLSDQSLDSSEPRVRVLIQHADLPVEWLEDMTAIWSSKIDQWVYQSRPKQQSRR
jgi:hypothetical protein